MNCARFRKKFSNSVAWGHHEMASGIMPAMRGYTVLAATSACRSGPMQAWFVLRLFLSQTLAGRLLCRAI